MTENSSTLLTAAEAADAVGLSISALWRQVAAGRLPQPVYPTPRAPRWYAHELRDALERTRMLPRDALAMRRKAKIERAKPTAGDAA
jgi:predicted DNA-binding transcriptional regulator AlpA